MVYQLKTTNAYAERIAAATAGETLLLTHIAFGDGTLTPSEETEELVNEVYRAEVEQKGHLTMTVWAKGKIPAEEGGWWIKEIALYGRLSTEAEEDVVLLASATVSDTYKPLLAVGENKDVWYRVMIDNVPATALPNISFTVDGSVALLTLADLNDYLEQDRLAADVTIECTTALLKATLDALPKNLNGHTAIINVDGDATLAAPLNIYGFFGGRLDICWTSGTITLGNYGINIRRNDCYLYIQDIQIAAAGSGKVTFGQNRFVNMVAFDMEHGVGASYFSHVTIEDGGPVIFTGTTNIAGAADIHNIHVMNGGVCRILGTYNFGVTVESALLLDAGADAESLVTMITGDALSMVAAGATYTGKFNRHDITLKATTNLSWMPRAGYSHYVFDAAGTAYQATIMIIGIRDGYIYYRLTDGTIPNDGSTYTIKVANDSGMVWIAEIVGSHGTTGFLTIHDYQ